MAYIFIYFGFEGDANANILSSHGSKWISFMLNIAETMKQNNILGFSHLYDYDRFLFHQRQPFNRTNQKSVQAPKWLNHKMWVGTSSRAQWNYFCFRFFLLFGLHLHTMRTSALRFGNKFYLCHILYHSDDSVSCSCS